SGSPKGFEGATFDGRYVYFVPYGLGAQSGVVARFDTLGQFDKSAAWATFDVTAVNANAKGFIGATFDGRYLRLVPNDNSIALDGLVANLDTGAQFDAKQSWTT